jgi:hypothetical protein
MTPSTQVVASTLRLIPGLTPPWAVRSWPTVLWQAIKAQQLQFVHLGTRVLTYGDDEYPSCGQTLWGDPGGEVSAGVAWDWVQIQAGVVAMADPFDLSTNLCLLDEKGTTLSGRERAVRLNELVHRLPWQTEVHRVLRQGETVFWG